MIDVKIDRYGRVREVRRIHIPWAELGYVVLLIVLAALAALWLSRLTDSVMNYHPITDEQLPAGATTQPLAQQLVLIVAEGLRDDASMQMPFLSSLRQRGAWARVTVPAPSLSLASCTTLVTGAGPEINEAPLMNVPAEQLQPIAVDHLFAGAKQYGLATGLAASSPWWSRLISPQWRDVSFFVNSGTPAERDRRTADAALGFLKNYSADFLLVYFGQVDETGHDFGVNSAEYQDAVRQVDSLIAQVVTAVDLQKAVVIVTSDHGQLDQGGHGGPEEPVVTVPFVMAGRQVVPGSYAPIHQTDIAPTIATILGTAIPAMAQGDIRFEMLDMPPDLKVEKVLAEGQQRLALGEVMLSHLGSGEAIALLSEETASLGVVRTSLELGNYDSAFKLAIPTVRRIDIAVQTTRLDDILDEQNRRWPQALAIALLPLVVWWWRRSLRAGYLTLAAIFAFTFPLGQGRLWSLVSDLAPRATNVVLQIGIATGLGLVVVLGWLWWERDRRAGQLVSVVLIAGLAVGAYYGLFNSPGGTYTPSAIRSVESYGRELVGRAALALGLGGAILVAGLWWERETRVKAIIGASYGFVFLLAYGLIQALAVCYWRDGLVVTWYVPDLNWLFLHATTLAELIAVASLGIALPVFTFSAIWLLGLLSRRVVPAIVKRKNFTL
jgi:hypothetical protein